MIRYRNAAILLCPGLLVACAEASPRPAAPVSAYAAARLVPAAPAPPPATPAIAGGAAAGPALLPAPARPTREAARPLARVEAANRTAAREPTGHGYVNAAQVYEWAEGALYRLYTAPERVSEIALQPGEQLVSVAAGDTVRWVIGDTSSGAGRAKRTHVLVKPTAAGLRTNLVIATDRRVYHVALESTSGPAMASIAWSYPQDSLMALEPGGDDPGAAGGPDLPDVESLDFGYVIEGDDPPWRPRRAFDDGSQVYIEFPESLAQGQAPPLFVSGEGGRAELVNYRVRGRFYIVDRLFAAAELRLGERHQQVVRIRAFKRAHGSDR